MIVIYITCKDEFEAEKIAYSLVSKKLAVCTNIIKTVKSIYLWKGNMEEGNESVLIVKTKKSLFKKAENEIRKLHSYDNPEIISWKVERTTDDIKRWLDSELSL